MAHIISVTSPEPANSAWWCGNSATLEVPYARTLGSQMRIERELMRGAGPVAVMQLLARREMYGYEIAEALARRSDGVLDMGHSTLYPLLYNLEAKGLITSREEQSDSGRYRR